MFWTEQEMKENHILKKYGRIRWQDDYETDCTFTWYESKKELRITGFGRGMSPLSAEFTGALFVLVKETEKEYQGYLLNTDDDIEQFLDTFDLTPAETNRLIEINRVSPKTREKQAIDSFVGSLSVEFPTSSEMSLAAKTTCKDRWRQILNEADRLRDSNKYLCTMQQGISASQMDEMQAEKVILVVPKKYHSAYPQEKRDRIWTIGRFVRYVKEMEGPI